MENDFLKSFAQRAKRRLVGKEPTNVKIKIIEKNDAAFRSKVESLLAKDEVITNPAKFLLDERVMKNMTDAEKERYLLTTLDKYTALRHELEHDKVDSCFCI